MNRYLVWTAEFEGPRLRVVGLEEAQVLVPGFNGEPVYQPGDDTVFDLENDESRKELATGLLSYIIEGEDVSLRG